MAKKEARLNLKLGEDLLTDFKAAADKKQLSVSALIRILMLDYLKNEK